MRLEFTKATKKARFIHCHRVDGVPHCEYCGGTFSASNPPEYHHHKEAESGGDNSFENCRVIGAKCCHTKATGQFKTACARSDRIRDKNVTRVHKPKSRPMDGTRQSNFKKRMDGTVVRREA